MRGKGEGWSPCEWERGEGEGRVRGGVLVSGGGEGEGVESL